MNLSDSCRDVLRRLKTKEPRKCWKALIAEYDQQNPTSQMMLLNGLLELKCTGPTLRYISEFNLTVSKLQSMSISFDERLLIALLLRGHPDNYDVFYSTIRHRENVPTLDQLCAMIKMEEKTLTRRQEGAAHTASTRRVPRAGRCSGCGRTGHTERGCWTLHPELAPRCRLCNVVGHTARYCRTSTVEVTQSNLVNADDQFGGLPPINL
jgi:hypothetical protein